MRVIPCFRSLEKYAVAAIVVTRLTWAIPGAPGLLDPSQQWIFVETCINALDPVFRVPVPTDGSAVEMEIRQTTHQTGIENSNGTLLDTPIWGYGLDGRNQVSWPGPTFQVMKNEQLNVRFNNRLYGISSVPFTSLEGLPVVDTSIHWAFGGLDPPPTLEMDGFPIVTHLHGAHDASHSDGNPDHWYTPNFMVLGPRFLTDFLEYTNEQPATALFYHDHVLGMTRLTVNAGLVGLYFIRDEWDTGDQASNPLKLPVYPYEAAFAIQDRMFKEDGEFFYPAYPGEPEYHEFINEEGAELPTEIFGEDGGPSVMTEFFGDFILVNGKIWPRFYVEPRRYRLRLLNACDSRFLIFSFVPTGPFQNDAFGDPLPYIVIGTDQGLLDHPQDRIIQSVLGPGERIDIVIDFSALQGSRIIMKNAGGDEPFGGDIPGPRLYQYTDRVMAFDVQLPLNSSVPNEPLHLPAWPVRPPMPPPVLTRRVGLFEGRDEFGRLMPLLGGGTDTMATRTWDDPTTETPALDSTEIWEIYNFSEDAHPIHLHLVSFRVIERRTISFGECHNAPPGPGLLLDKVPQMLHNGANGTGYVVTGDFHAAQGPPIQLGREYASEIGGPKDVVTALPGQVTKIQAYFDRPGRFVWHCHILSHEDHEMMRPFQVS